ncbi:MAG TPA: hypothetical protein VK540_34930 [Polyangiaceae bacterium]|jgi:uncharacterized membrane protein YraQ (UPF0718 family)|nr:hypothetical protein [Polyangiaceae bacterium]
MRIAAAVMAVLVVLLGALCVWRGGVALLGEGVRAGGRGALPLVPLLAVVFLLAGFAEVLLPRATIAAWLSDAAGVRGLLIAWVAGALTPGGGPVGLPLAAALMRSGAGVGVLVTYVTSMSLLSFVRVPLELGTYGPRLTMLRVMSSVVLPLIAGATAQFFSAVVR